ncbi:hypothetical protein VIBNISOn1_270019 [Vibrio nigripulchritudo SOn1]|uniref:Uncharacterized protein n=1 Tax=Vibrio nigripulchritudo SOn1 TaxID=1238450 RepID=A0AAV2VR60_9VIBR|nr:hypothetical protein VIBNISOn1_270019 [Vibrio nigripulchritudo SOn1]
MMQVEFKLLNVHRYLLFLNQSGLIALLKPDACLAFILTCTQLPLNKSRHLFKSNT